MIEQLHRLSPVPLTRDDYLITRMRMSLGCWLRYREYDMRDAAQMFALGDATHEQKRIPKTAAKS